MDTLNVFLNDPRLFFPVLGLLFVLAGFAIWTARVQWSDQGKNGSFTGGYWKNVVDNEKTDA